MRRSDAIKEAGCVLFALVAIVLSLLVTGFAIGSLAAWATVPEEPVPEPAQPKVVEEPAATEYAVLLEPVPEVVALGEFKITHYCPCARCCGEWADGITYTGTTATEGRTIAVDPDVIPLGSTVVVDGLEYIAEDIGGAVQGNRIDVFMDSHQAALVEGIKTAEVYIVKEATGQ